MKKLLILCCVTPFLVFASHTSSLEKILAQIENEIEIFDGDIQGLIRIMNLVESELHFARYEELCKQRD
jgi:hypothetical protein